MKQLMAIISALILTACGVAEKGSSSSDTALQQEILNSAKPNTVSGTVPGTVIEAFGDNGSYIRVESTQPSSGVDDGKHPFTIELQPNVGYRLVMTTNEGTVNEVITPISFYSDNSFSKTQTRFKIDDGSKVYLGHIDLALDPAEMIDTNNDGIVDSFVLDNEFNPLKQSDQDKDGIDDFDDEDHGQYQYKDSRQDALDPDGDGVVNVYDKDDDNDGVPDESDSDDDNDGIDDVDEPDSDHDGIKDDMDVNVNNDELSDNRYDTKKDTDQDGYANEMDADDDNNGVLDINEDDDGDGITNANDTDADGNGISDSQQDDDGDGIKNENDRDANGDGIVDNFEDDDADGEPNISDDNTDSGSSDSSGGTGNASNKTYQLLAANDLGMHCADIDYQVFSILPPFNVVHAQVIEKGAKPTILDASVVSVSYQATSNPKDPIVQNTTDLPSINTGQGNTKTNFWQKSDQLVPNGFNAAGLYATFGTAGYQSLYPGVQVSSVLGGADLSGLCGDSVNLADCPSLLMAFEQRAEDTGLPVPDLNKLYPSTSTNAELQVAVQKMPGVNNEPQQFHGYVSDLPFFEKFDFGSRLKNRDWFTAEGVPVIPYDDQGRSNTYPLMKITAHDKQSQQALASVDVVLPVASEADCQSCHVEPLDCADPDLPLAKQSQSCNGEAVKRTVFNVMTLDDNPPGLNRLEQLLNTAKINILRLHDVKHGADYQQWSTTDKTLVNTACDLNSNPSDPNCLVNQTPIQCSQCHYSPALDLVQGGPVDEPEQGVKGRQQTRHASMSNVMHRFHGLLTVTQNGVDVPLFPKLPEAGSVQRSGLPAINTAEQDILENSCYQCHPGKQTQCLRGAMAKGGVICQDCHGDMENVGSDFSIRVNKDNPGDFVMDGSLRVPWADEPKCQSCHTGDALNNNHPAGGIVANDGIRLLSSHNVISKTITGIPAAVKVAIQHDSQQSRFAENAAINAKGDTVPVLYRLSKDEHGGVKCEGCHNSTHAIWPNPLASANDNVAAIQLQGHAGTITECSTCHGDVDLGKTLGGPHGMHPVGGGKFANGGHEDLFENHKTECQSCHGVNGNGTVLSRVSTNRDFKIKECEGGTLCAAKEQKNLIVSLQKGEQVSCGMCHENVLATGYNGD